MFAFVCPVLFSRKNKTKPDQNVRADGEGSGGGGAFHPQNVPFSVFQKKWPTGKH